MARADGRSANELRTLSCTRALLHRAHASARWSQDGTIVLAAVYGPKASSKKENAEKSSLEVTWKPKTGLPGKPEKECEQILKRTLDFIFLSAMLPNTSIAVILQVVNDDGSLLSCALNAACAAMLDAGVPLKNTYAAICCGVRENGEVILDPSKTEEQELQAHVHLVFPTRPLTVLSENQATKDNERIERVIITSVTRGAMSVESYLDCMERGGAAALKISEFVRSIIEKQGSI